MNANHSTELNHLLDRVARLCAGETQSEADLMQAIDALATRLISEEPMALHDLIDQVQMAPLVLPASRQLLDYYRALAFGLCEEYDVALTHFATLLAAPNLDERVQARALNSRAVFCRITGRLGEAIAGYQASLALWQRLGDRLNAGKVLLNLGVIAYQLQEYGEAEQRLATAADYFAALGEPSRLASVQNELGLVYRDQGRWGKALACFEETVAYWRSAGGQESLGRALNNLGEVLLLQGRPAEASAVLHEALAQMQTRVYAVDGHLNLGLAALATADLAAARHEFTLARDLAYTIDRRDILAQVHYRLGDVLCLQGDRTAAKAELAAAVAIIEATREPLQDEGVKISLLGRWQQIYELLVLLAWESGQAIEALLWAERARARAFGELVGQRAEDRRTEDGGIEDGETVGSGGEEGLLTEVQARLAPDHLVLCYFTTGVLDRNEPFLRTLSRENPLRRHLLPPARTLLFVVNQTSVTVIPCPLDPNALTSNTRRQEDRSRFFQEQVLKGLCALLLPPDRTLQNQLVKAQRLYLIPHGPLHGIPFAALIGPDGQPFLQAGGAELLYAPSLTLLHHALTREMPPITTSAHTGTLAVGYNGADPKLRHPEAEAQLIANLTGGEAWIGAAVTRAELQEKAARAVWLHLACHGWFDYGAPLDSYLEISAQERLTAREVLAEWRLSASVVTLSACQTGVNRVLRGDEPMGLIRGFLAAGAALVLATQWPVEDLPTLLLMGHFYGELMNQQERQHETGQPPNPAAALHQAQVWLRNLTLVEVQALCTALSATVNLPLSADSVHPFVYPRHWAGFLLYVG